MSRCPHPEKWRRALGGFGRGDAEATHFFCQLCQSKVEILRDEHGHDISDQERRIIVAEK